MNDRIGNTAQVGGIETAVLDNGPGKGNRIAWINTGSGLRYKVVIDRAMDIAEAFYNQHSLCWLSHQGLTRPVQADHGLEWLYSFGGGLLTTCGLSHIGGPESDETGARGLHGRISNIPASLESIIQPDVNAAAASMSLTGTVKESAAVTGPRLELKRTILSPLGMAKIMIHDVVTNRGNVSAPLMLLYHCNFGWPLIDEGTRILWKGKWTTAGRDMDAEIFNNANDFRTCPAPLATHRGPREALAFIIPEDGPDGNCLAGFYNSKLYLALAMRFNKKQLPWLMNWQHWGPGEYVTGLEPGTNPPIGQSKARKQNELMYLEPGQSKSFDLEIAVLSDPKQITDFISAAV